VSSSVEAHLLVVADSLECGVDRHLGIIDGVGAEIGELGRLDVAPHQRGGVEVRAWPG